MDTSEKRFEQDIEIYFLNHGFRKVLPSTYDKEKMLFSDVLEEFVSTTQPKAWARYTKLYGASAVDKLTRRVNTAISERLLNHGDYCSQIIFANIYLF